MMDRDKVTLEESIQKGHMDWKMQSASQSIPEGEQGDGYIYDQEI